MPQFTRSLVVRSVARTALGLLTLLAVAATPTRAQDLLRFSPTVWVGQAQSYEVSYGIWCTLVCGPGKGISGRWARSDVVGVDLSFFNHTYGRLVSGLSIAQRGGSPDQTSHYVSFPLMLVAEPFGAAAPLGVSVGGGLQGEWNFNRASESNVSVLGDVGAYVRLPRIGRVVVGFRVSRTLLERDLGSLRTESAYFGIRLR